MRLCADRAREKNKSLARGPGTAGQGQTLFLRFQSPRTRLTGVISSINPTSEHVPLKGSGLAVNLV
jgi:hypothetical protein